MVIQPFHYVNGDGMDDTGDVMVFFKFLDWIAGNEPVAAFDFNSNGGIEFDDVVRLYKKL
jgi:PKD repeat protein